MRTGLSLLLAIVFALLFLFVPDFNWGGSFQYSMFEQFIREGRIMEMVGFTFVVTALAFVGFMVLFGAGKEEEEKKEKGIVSKKV